jgi:hypothetical protein
MASPGADLERLLARQTVISLALQALIEHLLVSGRIEPRDLVTMREFGLQITDDLKAHGGTGAQVGGHRVETEIWAWWDALGVPAGMGRVR